MSKRNRTNNGQFVYYCPKCEVIVQKVDTKWHQSKIHHFKNNVVCDSQIHASCTRCNITRVWDSRSKHKCQLTTPQPINPPQPLNTTQLINTPQPLNPYQYDQTGFDDFIDNTQINQTDFDLVVNPQPVNLYQYNQTGFNNFINNTQNNQTDFDNFINNTQYNQTGFDFIDNTQNKQADFDHVDDIINNNSVENNENSIAGQYNQATFDSVTCRDLQAKTIISEKIFTLSDERYKHNIHPLDPSDAQLLLQSLKIYVYQLKGSDNGDQNVGTVAQDIANNKDIPEYLKKLVLKIQPDPNDSGKERYVVDYQSLISIYMAFSTNQDMVFTDVICRRKYTRLWSCFPTNEEGILKVNTYRLTFYSTSQTITITRDQVHYVGHIRMEADLGKLWTIVGYKDECGNPKTIYFIIYQELVRFPIFGGGTKLFEAIEKSFPDKRNEAFGPPKPHWIKTTLCFILLCVGFMVTFLLFIASIEYMIPEHWKQDVDTFLEDFVIPKLMTIAYFVVCCLFIFYLIQAARK